MRYNLQKRLIVLSLSTVVDEKSEVFSPNIHLLNNQNVSLGKISEEMNFLMGGDQNMRFNQKIDTFSPLVN